jgi:hypothetical protein
MATSPEEMRKAAWWWLKTATIENMNGINTKTSVDNAIHFMSSLIRAGAESPVNSASVGYSPSVNASTL